MDSQDPPRLERETLGDGDEARTLIAAPPDLRWHTLAGPVVRQSLDETARLPLERILVAAFGSHRGSTGRTPRGGLALRAPVAVGGISAILAAAPSRGAVDRDDVRLSPESQPSGQPAAVPATKEVLRTARCGKKHG